MNTNINKLNLRNCLVGAVDKLMDELKIKVGRLGGIYERSDAMLANYPGDGSRFARHIDNTTGDGRRLTVLIYLNPDWDRSAHGGALRLTPADQVSTCWPLLATTCHYLPLLAVNRRQSPSIAFTCHKSPYIAATCCNRHYTPTIVSPT